MHDFEFAIISSSCFLLLFMLFLISDLKLNGERSLVIHSPLICGSSDFLLDEKKNTKWIIHEHLRRNRVIAKNWNSLFLHATRLRSPTYLSTRWIRSSWLLSDRKLYDGAKIRFVSLRSCFRHDYSPVVCAVFFCTCCCASKMYMNCASI